MGRRPFRTTRKIANLRQGRNDWYQLRNSAGEASVLRIYDEIGFFGVTAQDLVRDLAGAADDLEVHLHCPGGDVFEGLAIYNALAQRRGTVRVIVDSLAASAASFIAQAASPGQLVVAKNASMMIHDAFGMGIGNSKDMRELADLLDQQSDNIAGIYADRSGRPVAAWRDAMRAETWYVGQEAVDAGLADAVQGGRGGPQAVFDLSLFARTPAHLRAAAGDGDGTADDDDGNAGDGPWDPDGDGDDDSTPEGDTDHSHWAEDGTQLKPVPGKPMPASNRAPRLLNADATTHGPFDGTHEHMHGAMGGPDGDGDGNHDHEHSHDGDGDHDHSHAGVLALAVPAVLNAGADESAWDGAAAMSAAAKSADPAAAYKAICAGRRSGDPDRQSSWALPHHRHPGDAPNAAGVRNALARLPQTQGLTNEAAAKAHLEAHMSAISPDSGTSDRATGFLNLSDDEMANAIAALKEAQ